MNECFRFKSLDCHNKDHIFSMKYVCGFQQNGKPKRIELWNMSNQTNEVD